MNFKEALGNAIEEAKPRLRNTEARMMIQMTPMHRRYVGDVQKDIGLSLPLPEGVRDIPDRERFNRMLKEILGDALNPADMVRDIYNMHFDVGYMKLERGFDFSRIEAHGAVVRRINWPHAIAPIDQANTWRSAIKFDSEALRNNVRIMEVQVGYVHTVKIQK